MAVVVVTGSIEAAAGTAKAELEGPNISSRIHRQPPYDALDGLIHNLLPLHSTSQSTNTTRSMGVMCVVMCSNVTVYLLDFWASLP